MLYYIERWIFISCYLPVTVHIFNQTYGTEIDAKRSGIDIYQQNIMGRDILKRLSHSFDICKHRTKDKWFPWEGKGKQKAKKKIGWLIMIKLLIMDVDGTLTDGKIYLSSTDEEFKSFDVKDGYAIAKILPEHGIQTAIITGRNSEIVKKRAQELAIPYVMQGIQNKQEALYLLMEQTGYSEKEIAYIGDDIPDLTCMKLCGYTGCPADADIQIQQIVDYICTCRGGYGAVREFCMKIIERNTESKNKVNK